jgi:hypothetical protein
MAEVSIKMLCVFSREGSRLLQVKQGKFYFFNGTFFCYWGYKKLRDSVPDPRLAKKPLYPDSITNLDPQL